MNKSNITCSVPKKATVCTKCEDSKGEHLIVCLQELPRKPNLLATIMGILSINTLSHRYVHTYPWGVHSLGESLQPMRIRTPAGLLFIGPGESVLCCLTRAKQAPAVTNLGDERNKRRFQWLTKGQESAISGVKLFKNNFPLLLSGWLIGPLWLMLKKMKGYIN